MPNLGEQFKKFHEEILLSKTQKSTLSTSRDSDRDAIKTYFKDTLKQKVPDFEMQGSYIMGTVVNPPKDGEYDLDDGVYLNNLPADFLDDTNHITNAHNWIEKALADKTKEGVTDKNTCVRLTYAKNYHIDFPIYCKSNDITYLAHKSAGWIQSSPIELKEWFEKVTADCPQKKKIVRYLKAWRDFQRASSSSKFPSGMVLTLLAVQDSYYTEDDEDQYALLETCRKIHEGLSKSFNLWRPVAPWEDLLTGYSKTRKTDFLDKLASLISNGDAAIKCDKPSKASEKWIKVFGDRFPLADDPKETASPALLGSYGRSA